MFLTQVIIAGSLCVEPLGAQPAEDSVASCAVHLVAARYLLHGDLTAWACSSFLGVLPHPVDNSTSCFLAAAEHPACHSVVSLLVTRSARAHAAFWAKEHLRVLLACNAVHHWTVRGGAEVSLVAIGHDVSREGGTGEIREFGVTKTRQVVEVSPRQREVAPFVAADDRQVVVLDCNGHLQIHSESQSSLNSLCSVVCV